MLEGTLERLAGKIESIWAASSVWPDYVEAMRRALPARTSKTKTQGASRLNWVTIPNVCCQAVGGDPEWADEISLAWLLFNIAAHVFDSVEDQDQPDAWWQEIGPAAGLNAASGLFFTATLALNRLHRYTQDPDAVQAINQRFFTQLIQMSAGQHRDLTLTRFTLEDYWEIAAAKSGKFFSLASWAGARLACTDEKRLDGFARYGQHFGLLVQLLDDLLDIREIDPTQPFESKAILRSFAAAYALDVLTGPERDRLAFLLGEMALIPEKGSQLGNEALALIEGSGGALYLTIEVERNRALALAALEQAQPTPSEKETLAALLPDLQSI